MGCWFEVGFINYVVFFLNIFSGFLIAFVLQSKTGFLFLIRRERGVFDLFCVLFLIKNVLE